MKRNRFKMLMVSVLTILMGSVSYTASQTCEEYVGAPSFPYWEGGLDDFHGSINIATKGNYAYLFDKADLDCLNLEDPDQWTIVHEHPPINFEPELSPSKLIRVGDDRLYAFRSSTVTIIDITSPGSPFEVKDVASFGEGAYAGEWNSHIFFVNKPSGENIKMNVYRVSDPDNPSWAASYTLPVTGGSVAGTASANGAVYILVDRALGSYRDFVVYDVSSPMSASLTDHINENDFDGEDEPLALTNVIFNESSEPMFVDENTLYVSYADGQLAPESSHTAIIDLSAPDFLEPSANSSLTISAAANNKIYAWDTDLGSQGWVALGGTTFDWDPFRNPGPYIGTMALTDRSILFTYRGPDRGMLVAAPRECDAPQIVPGSVSRTLTYRPDGKVDLVVNWRTSAWSDPLFDEVTISDTPRNPPAGTIGTVVLIGGEQPVYTVGSWLHERSYTFQQCVPKARYNIEVKSVRTGLSGSAAGTPVKFTYCLPQYSADLGGSTLDLQSHPNPFNPSTILQFNVPEGAGNVRLEIYQVDGSRIATLHNGASRSGIVNVRWNGTDAAGRRMTSGIYFARLTIDSQVSTKKLIMLK